MEDVGEFSGGAGLRCGVAEAEPLKAWERPREDWRARNAITRAGNEERESWGPSRIEWYDPAEHDG